MVRGYSESKVVEMGFPRKDYKFPTVAGRGTGTLVMKMWSKKCLICYFELDDGEKIKLCAFREHEHDRFFFPNKSKTDMASVEIGSRMEIEYGITKTGNASFLDATVCGGGESE